MDSASTSRSSGSDDQSSSTTGSSASPILAAPISSPEEWVRVADVALHCLPKNCDPNRYWVSDKGRVKSLIKGITRYLQGQVHQRDGYVQISFWAGASTTPKLHRLICTAFHGPAPEGYQANHKDGNRLNNAADNLEWLSAAENNGLLRASNAVPTPKTAKQLAFKFVQPSAQVLKDSVWKPYAEDPTVEVSDTGYVRKVGKNRLINVVCSESGHQQADWETSVQGKRKHFKRMIQKMVYVTHHGPVGKESNGRDLAVDHIDENPSNNNKDNLQLLTHKDNRRKSTQVNSNNTSGVTGVHQLKNGRWAAQIHVDMRAEWLGTFSTFDGAVAARDAAERKHGFGKHFKAATPSSDHSIPKPDEKSEYNPLTGINSGTVVMSDSGYYSSAGDDAYDAELTAAIEASMQTTDSTTSTARVMDATASTAYSSSSTFTTTSTHSSSNRVTASVSRKRPFGTSSPSKANETRKRSRDTTDTATDARASFGQAQSSKK